MRDESALRILPRQVAFLVRRRPEKPTKPDRTLLEHIRGAHPDFGEAIGLAEAYLRMIRERDAEALDPWLKQAEANRMAPFRRFAKSLRRDYGAVRAALEQSWSTGPVEGHINKLKLFKRQMYGRAKLDLLSKRLLHAA